MESERPRGISILAIDSAKPRGIAIPAVRAVAADAAFILTRTLSGTFSSVSVPIRAPLTIDDDDDVDDESGSEHELASSVSSSYSKGLDSGSNDGFESGSVEADDEDETIGEEIVGGSGDLSEFSGGSVVYKPFASDIVEDSSINYSSFGEESDESGEAERVSDGEVSEAGSADMVSVKAKVAIPRAVLSLDDDEFDEILGSGDEGDTLLHVMNDLGDGKAEVDEPECLDSVIGEIISTEEEVVRMKHLDKLNNGFIISLGNIDEQSLGVPPSGSKDFSVENEHNFTEESIELGGSSKQLIKTWVVQRSIIKEDGDGSVNDIDALMKLAVQNNEFELEEMGVTDKPGCYGSVSSAEDMVEAKFSGENSLAVVPGDCFELMDESEGNAIDADRGLDVTFSQLVEQGGQESICKENNNTIDDASSCEVNESMFPGEGSIGLKSNESEDEDTGTMIGGAKGHCETEYVAISALEKPECEGEPETGPSSERFNLTPTLDSVTARNLEVAGGIDVVSECGSSDLKAEHGNVGKQEPEDIDRKLSLLDEDRASSLRNSFETANENVENGGQVSYRHNKQVQIQSHTEPKQISVGVEETSLKDVENIIPEISSVIACDITEYETEMARLILNDTLMELDEHEETGDTREKLSESSFEKYSEELSSNMSVQLISEKVKERVEKTQLLKEKLQRIIRRTGRCGEISAVTEVESKLRLSGGKHQTSLGLDYVPDVAKTVLPEPDFSINVLVIGKTGVGKSATVNSIFGEIKSPVGAFGVTTKSGNYVVGNVGGLMIKILDTPGLVSSATEEWFNQEVLMSVKKSMRTFPVDVVLYIGRVDENPDIHLLKTITDTLGSSIWRKAILVLTHAASDVADSSSYKDFIAQRSSLMHQSIRQAVPELTCIDQSKMPEIFLAENSMSSLSTCPDWRLNLLILCCSVKIQSKTDSLQKKNAFEEKRGLIGSQLRSFTLFCSLWNVLLLGANSGQTSQSHDDEKKRHLLVDAYPEILWDERREECPEHETIPTNNQELEDEERQYENGKTNRVVGRVRSARGRLGFQATKMFGIYLDTSDLHTGFSIGNRGYRKKEQQEEEGGGKRTLVTMRGSMAMLGLVLSVFTSVYATKNS